MEGESASPDTFTLVRVRVRVLGCGPPFGLKEWKASHCLILPPHAFNPCGQALGVACCCSSHSWLVLRNVFAGDGSCPAKPPVCLSVGQGLKGAET